MNRLALFLVACLAATSAQGYRGEKMSLEAREIEVREVLQRIADLTGLDIITSDTVGGRLTLMLKDVPWDQALDIVLEAKGLAKRVSGRVVLIAPARELAAKQGPAEPYPPARLHTWSFKLDFADGQDLRKRIARVLSRHGAVSLDERTNTLFVRDVEEALVDAERLVRRLDVAPPYPA